MAGKIIIPAVGLLLVVGIVIGVVAVVHRDGGETETVTTHSKAVTDICQPTNYKEECMKSLSSANSSDPKDLIRVGILAVSDSVKKSFNLSDDLVAKADKESKRSKTALSDCKELLNDASEKLQDIIEKVNASDIQTIANRSDDFRTWMSYVIGYQELCMDGFDQDSEVRADVRQSTEVGNQLTDNVLEILAGIQKVLSSYGLKLNLTGITEGGEEDHHRRLLQDNGYPRWMSATDRKLLASNPNMVPNAVVAKDGSGKFKTISAALAAYPPNLQGRYVIYVKSGVYNEQVTVGKKMKNVYMYGDGPRKSILTGHLSFAKDGLGTWKTASFVVEADGFIAKSMGFQNTAGPEGHQAVAVRSLSDQSAFINCRLDGFQDTLCYQGGRQFFRNCVLSGTIDFLFGYGSVVVQNSLIVVRRPMDNQFNTVTADGKKEKGQPTGIVIHNCRIVPEAKLVPDRFKLKTYLGRPWKPFATTVVMESELGDLIQPDGWKEWDGSQFLDTLYYAEYANRGPGANTARRIKWKTVRFLSKKDAMQWTVESFLQGRAWIANTGATALFGLKA
ncbi:Probable pectinesterase/pectinesterase inhibitor 58 [Linum perenne]